jgi:hypothetical protein
LTELVYCVTVAFTMTELTDHLHHDNAPAHSTALVQHRFGSLDFWLFPKLKPPLKGRGFVNATVTEYTRSVSGVSLPTD